MDAIIKNKKLMLNSTTYKRKDFEEGKYRLKCYDCGNTWESEKVDSLDKIKPCPKCKSKNVDGKLIK